MPCSFKLYNNIAVAFAALGVVSLSFGDVVSALCEGDHDILSYDTKVYVDVSCPDTSTGAFTAWQFGSNAGPYSNLYAQGWDLNQAPYGCPAQAMVSTFSSYEELPEDTEINKHANLTLVNWLINHYTVGSYVDFGSDCFQGYLDGDFYQTAVEELVGDIPNDGINCISEKLVEEAETNGQDFEPSCDDDPATTKIGVVLTADRDDLTYDLQLEQDTGQVVWLAEVYLSNITGICECAEPGPVVSVSGDPHFRTWAGTLYDFHGVCDLVLLQNPEFVDGLGLNIHIRTSELKQFSYVSSAALQIGNDILEVRGGDNPEQTMYWMNKLGYKIEGTNGIVNFISGYPISYERLNSKQHKFTVDLGGDTAITMTTFKKIVRVEIVGSTEESFGTSRGLLGSYGSSDSMIARDNVTLLQDVNEFGAEWQVLPFEEMLFHSVEGPQAPEKCVIPVASSLRRRLAESNISEQEAKIACALVHNVKDFEMCVFDVMATGDKDLVGAY